MSVVPPAYAVIPHTLSLGNGGGQQVFWKGTETAGAIQTDGSAEHHIHCVEAECPSGYFSRVITYVK